MEIQACPVCGVTVLPNSSGQCPSCRRDIVGSAPEILAPAEHEFLNPSGAVAEIEAVQTHREFSRIDAFRVIVGVAFFAGTGCFYWYFLPVVQSLVIPIAPGGLDGPWVVRPILAFHFGAVAVLTAVTFPLLLSPYQKMWNRSDVELGTRYDHFCNRPERRTGVVAKGFVLLAIYGVGLIFYLEPIREPQRFSTR